MNLNLIHGQFSSKDAIDIITQMTQVKIKYHEDKIHHTNNEEDIKMREQRIKKLQDNLAVARKHIENKAGVISLHCEIIM